MKQTLIPAGRRLLFGGCCFTMNGTSKSGFMGRTE